MATGLAQAASSSPGPQEQEPNNCRAGDAAGVASAEVHQALGNDAAVEQQQAAAAGASARDELHSGSESPSSQQEDDEEEDGCSAANPDAHANGGEMKSRQQQREERRRHNNALRKARRKAGKRACREERIAAQEELPEEERLQQQARWREQKQRAAEAKRAQEERLQQALAGQGPALRIAVECSFSDHPGNEKMIRSLCKQLEVALGFNKKSERPAAVLVCSFTGRVAQIGNSMTAQGWRAQKLEKAAVELFPCQDLVILSPDAELPLLEVDVNKVYCIGGIVDRTVQKGLTLGYADEKGATARRLPIEEHAAELGLPRGSPKNPVLNVNDAIVALIEYHRTGCWVTALDAAIPGRKRRCAPGLLGAAADTSCPPPPGPGLLCASADASCPPQPSSPGLLGASANTSCPPPQLPAPSNPAPDVSLSIAPVPDSSMPSAPS